MRVEQVNEQDARSLGLDWSATGGGLALSVLQGGLELSLDPGASAALRPLSTLKALETQGRSRTLINTRLVALDGTSVKPPVRGKLLLPQLTGGGGQGQAPRTRRVLHPGLRPFRWPSPQRWRGTRCFWRWGSTWAGFPPRGLRGVTVSNQSVTAKVRVRQGPPRSWGRGLPGGERGVHGRACALGHPPFGRASSNRGPPN